VLSFPPNSNGHRATNNAPQQKATKRQTERARHKGTCALTFTSAVSSLPPTIAPTASSIHYLLATRYYSTTSIMTTTKNTDAALQEAVAAINDQKHCFDVTIICTTDDFQAAYWMELLEHGLLQGRKVLAVSEDWESPGGAGNGLGTLYAYQKACKLAAQKYDNFNLAQALAEGAVSASLYHTAGKGTRMAPLPASENNNKPGVVSARCWNIALAIFER